MADVTVKQIDDFENYGNQFFYAGKGLGVKSFAMNVSRLPANWDKYPLHNHADDGQEEVYVVIEGSAVLEAEGQKWNLRPGVIARVGAKQKRIIKPGRNGVTIVALGGMPGKAWPEGKIRGPK